MHPVHTVHPVHCASVQHHWREQRHMCYLDKGIGHIRPLDVNHLEHTFLFNFNWLGSNPSGWFTM